MGINQYEALQASAERGDVVAFSEIMRIAMRRCDCKQACFFTRRACEFLENLGVRIAA